MDQFLESTDIINFTYPSVVFKAYELAKECSADIASDDNIQ